MAYTREKAEAQKLRRDGKSIAEIASLLQINKSTVSNWCRDIILSAHQVQNLAKKQEVAGALGRLRAAELKRKGRILRTVTANTLGVDDVKNFTERDLFILGIALYWGEGYKSGNDECGLTNSDPGIILFFIEWLWKIYMVSKDRLILRISVNESHQHRIADIENYWSNVTNIPFSQFTKTSVIRVRSKKVYSNANAHFGTLRVKVRRGTSLRRRIMGSVGFLRELAIK